MRVCVVWCVKFAGYLLLYLANEPFTISLLYRSGNIRKMSKNSYTVAVVGLER